jgi:hypothetical protein
LSILRMGVRESWKRDVLSFQQFYEAREWSKNS